MESSLAQNLQASQQHLAVQNTTLKQASAISATLSNLTEAIVDWRQFFGPAQLSSLVLSIGRRHGTRCARQFVDLTDGSAVIKAGVIIGMAILVTRGSARHICLAGLLYLAGQALANVASHAIVCFAPSCMLIVSMCFQVSGLAALTLCILVAVQLKSYVPAMGPIQC